MDKYSYPIVFHKEALYYIGHFPDFNCPAVFGHSFEDAYAMAEETLLLFLYELGCSHKAFPIPTPAYQLEGENSIVLTVTADLSAMKMP